MKSGRSATSFSSNEDFFISALGSSTSPELNLWKAGIAAPEIGFAGSGFFWSNYLTLGFVIGIRGAY